jgi:hypothetical protein
MGRGLQKESSQMKEGINTKATPVIKSHYASEAGLGGGSHTSPYEEEPARASLRTDVTSSSSYFHLTVVVALECILRRHRSKPKSRISPNTFVM